MFTNRKIKCKDSSSHKIDLQIQLNFKPSPKKVLSRTWQSRSKTYIEEQMFTTNVAKTFLKAR